MSAGGTAYAPTKVGAVSAIASLTLRRLTRSKGLWVAFALGLLPLVPLLISGRQTSAPINRWTNFMHLAAYMQLLVTAMLTAPIIAEEIEDKTYAYLWSRPIPRWSVLAGKLLVGTSVAILIMGLSTFLSAALVGVPGELARALPAIALGIIATGCLAAAIGTLLPKHPLAVSLAYFMVVDLGLSAMPFAAARLSLKHNTVSLANIGRHADAPGTSLAWLAGIAIVATLLTLRRLSRKELSTGS